MVEKISNFNITSSLLLVLLLLLPRPDLCHTAEEDSQCRFLDINNNTVNVTDGVGFPLIKSSISLKRMNPFVVAAASVGISVIMFAYLFLKSINALGLHMKSIGNLISLVVFFPYDIEECDGIMSRSRIRARGNY